MKGKTAIIGDGESILVFKAVGVEPFPVENAEQAGKTLTDIAKQYKIIILSGFFSVNSFIFI